MRVVISVTVLALAACGGSSGGGGPAQAQVADLTIHSSSITTQSGGSASIQVPNPGNIRFTNGDTAAHTIVVPAGSPGDCAPLNVGTIAAGATTPTIVVTNNTSGSEVCTFSDSANPSISGNITILTLSTGGSGY